MTTTPTPTPQPEQVKVRTWRPTTAGILNIVAGAIGLIAGIVLAAIGGAMGAIFGFGMLGAGATAGATVAIIFGIIAIVSGIYCLRRRIWGLALVGSILALILVFFLGIPAIIFVAQARKEFA